MLNIYFLQLISIKLEMQHLFQIKVLYYQVFTNRIDMNKDTFDRKRW